MRWRVLSVHRQARASRSIERYPTVAEVVNVGDFRSSWRRQHPADRADVADRQDRIRRRIDQRPAIYTYGVQARESGAWL